ncbi:hypothetical protein [Chryseobacterium nepalense]|uniref:hypothetical protein n=1 Tax=Chryseobacterium nepalense TaxID=1854498 RepID=UPI002E09EA83|nr:hypothetical protein [Chryseobacterium nepalense]
MASFNFLNLDDETRKFMMEEINYDIKNNNLFISERLNENGKKNYLSFLLQSVANGTEESFIILLSKENFNESEMANGIIKKVPNNASTLLCQSEFNRYYVRALCLRALNQGLEKVEIYRARESSKARPESEAKIGSFLDSSELLSDLRNSIGKAPKLFPDINSGLSVKI